MKQTYNRGVVEERRREAWLEGARLFDAGEFWECHEVLEPVWLESHGEEKLFLGGVILLAAALHKAKSMGSARGGRRNYAKALAKLALVDNSYHGIDVRELEARVHAALRQVDYQPAIPYLNEGASDSR